MSSDSSNNNTNETTSKFQYRIEFKSGDIFEHSIVLNEDTIEHDNSSDPPPDWCKLEYQQCPNCPLNKEDSPYCPLARSLVPLTKLDNAVSYEEVHAEVNMIDKLITTDTTLQQAISSMAGLLIATSGCPISSFFKPMAWYHHPFATQEDTIFRATSVYLLKQYFLAQNGEEYDKGFDGLSKIYDEMHIVNRSIARRISLTFESDSAANAIVLLDLFTKMLPIAIEDSLDDIKHIFIP